MLFLVDGYNVTRSDDATRRLPLEAQRDALVARLRARGRDLLGPGRIVVVFDGAGGVAGPGPSDSAPVEVRFARERSADDVIVSLAAESAEKTVLVSSDRELADRARAHAAHGLEVRRCSALWDSARPAGRRVPGKSRRGPYVPANAGLPKGANLITEELKGVWLAEDGAEDGGRDEGGES